MPDYNLASDPFEIIYSSKSIAENFNYVKPNVEIYDKGSYSFTGWPSGYPIIISIIIKVFGFDEMIIRIFTILFSLILIYLIIKITEIIFDNSSALIAGILISIHPLCVAFNSRIFTNNLATLLFYLAFYFLLKSLYKGDCILSHVNQIPFLKVGIGKHILFYFSLSLVIY